MKLPLNRVVCGDAFTVLPTFPDGCVDMVMFSPPYWGLRDYGNVPQVFGDQNCEHEWFSDDTRFGNMGGGSTKKEVTPNYRDNLPERNFCVKCGVWKGCFGLEPHPQMFIDHMVQLCRLLKRVLKKTGSMYLNLGDTYYGGGQGGGGKNEYKGTTEAYPQIAKGHKSNWLQPKQKLLMPARVAIALQHDGWILRNNIIWHKPNHMPSSVKDRLTSSYEHIYHFVQARRYYYDLDAIRQPHKEVDKRGAKRISYKGKSNPPSRLLSEDADFLGQNPIGKNPGDTLTTKHDKAVGRVGDFGYTDPLHTKPAHPKGKNPSDIIKTKGEECYGEDIGRRKRVLEHLHKTPHNELAHPLGKNPSDFWSINTKPFPEAHFAVYPEAICEMPIKSSCPPEGVVLDPMCGAGTTLLAAHKLGRKWIGIELNPSYVEMAKKRLKRECNRWLTEYS